MSGIRRKGALALAAISFVVATGAAALDEVRFAAPGAPDELADRLRATSLVRAAQLENTEDTQEVLAAARAEYARLLAVLYAEGYYGGVINVLVDGREAAELSPLNPPAQVRRIDVIVQPGPIYRFSRAVVDPVPPRTELPEGFRIGEPAKVPEIRDAVSTSIRGWRSAGYAKADVSGQSIVARHPARQVDAEIDIVTGPRVTFGQFSVNGANRVRESAIRRIAGFPEGERFSPERMERSAKRLRDTGAFRSVAMIEADNLQAGAVLPITATVVEELPRRFGFGAEIDSSDGIGVSAFWLHRNLFGGAEEFRVDAEATGLGGFGEEEGGFAGVDFTFGVAFTRPATFNPDTNLALVLALAQTNEEDYSSRSLTLGAGFIRNVNDLFRARWGIGYFYSRDETDKGITEYSLLTFPLGASSDKRDNPLNPARGWFGNIELTPFFGLNDASDDGARAYFDGRVYRGFGAEDRFVAAARLQLGSILGADLEDTPNDFRFYSGGGGTVRGHDYQNLGVTLPNGVSSGGASFLGVSLEARMAFREKLQGVAFVDYGYVGENWVPDDTGGDQVGAGLGLRYVTPIGPIRFDVAAPVSGPDSSSFQFYVGIGQAF